MPLDKEARFETGRLEQLPWMQGISGANEIILHAPSTKALFFLRAEGPPQGRTTLTATSQDRTNESASRPTSAHSARSGGASTIRPTKVTRFGYLAYRDTVRPESLSSMRNRFPDGE